MTDETPAETPPPTPAPLILATADMSQPQWMARKFRDNWALGKGGDVDVIRNAQGQLAAFVEDPTKLSDATRAEIAKILSEPRYATAAPSATATH